MLWRMVASKSDVLDRLVSPVANCLTLESARNLAALQLDPATRARIEELADKAGEGRLNETERGEYLDYVEIMDFVGLLQAKARELVSRS